MFFVLAGLLALAMAALVAAPLLRRAPDASPAERFNARVYRDQLAELTRDVERGLIAENEAAAARVEIERRLIAATKTEAEPESGASSAAPRAAGALGLVLVAAAFGLYTLLGSPPKAPPTPADPQEAAFAQMVDRVGQTVKATPTAEGWALYARSLARLGRYPQAVKAFEHAMTLAPEDASLIGDYAETRVLGQLGEVDPQAQAAFSEVLRREAGDPRARYYLALAKAQNGDLDGALTDLTALRDGAPPGSPLRAQLDSEMARLTR